MKRNNNSFIFCIIISICLPWSIMQTAHGKETRRDTLQMTAERDSFKMKLHCLHIFACKHRKADKRCPSFSPGRNQVPHRYYQGHGIHPQKPGTQIQRQCIHTDKQLHILRSTGLYGILPNIRDSADSGRTMRRIQ